MTDLHPTESLVSITGDDAEHFLQGQLTIDISALEAGDARHAAWCDASGRVITTLKIVRSGADFMLCMPSALCDAVCKRLRMFVLRSKVSVTPRPEYQTWLIAAAPPETVQEALRRHNALLLPTGDGEDVMEIWGPADAVEPIIQQAGLSRLEPQRYRIEHGLPWLDSHSTAQFQPQMLNLHWLGAVDFGKGCYPGQEVVARLQYRGSLKRRLFRVGCEQPFGAGSSLTDPDGNQVGQIIEAVEGNSWQATAVMSVEATMSPVFNSGKELQVLPLPYPVNN